jgi:hypothetical protein
VINIFQPIVQWVGKSPAQPHVAKISWHCLEVEKRLENLILNYVNGEKGHEFSNCEFVTS